MKPDIKYASDLDGTELVLVPLAATGKEATIEKSDYEFLVKLGVGQNWSLSGNGYVGAHFDSSRDYVARILMGCRPDQRLSYADGDKLNLRRSNLKVRLHRRLATTHQSYIREVA